MTRNFRVLTRIIELPKRNILIITFFVENYKHKNLIKRENRKGLQKNIFYQKEMTFRLNANIQVKMVKIKVITQTIFPVI